MFTRILVPIADQAHAARVREILRGLATHGAPQVTLVRVTSQLPEASEVNTTGAELGQLATQLGADGIDTHYLLEFDTPEGGIEAAAADTHTDVILLTPHARTGVDAWVHPSVTRRLVASATSPLLIWPDSLPDGYERDLLALPDACVIVPLDGSQRAERALPYAIDLANTYGRTLLLVRVATDLTSMSLGGDVWSVTPETLRAEEEAARHYLMNVRERCSYDVRGPVQSILATGAPARKILAIASAHPGSVLVMNTHGRGPIARAALGSVTDEVMRATPVPLLVIPTHAPERLGESALVKRAGPLPVVPVN